MTVLKNYNQFDGRHWETGCLYNFWDYRGIKASHTGQPYSEALMLGVSGGIVLGYFTFAYQGADPQARVLTRNTFDPVSTLLSRLGVVQNIYQTTDPKKAEANLLRELEDGLPVLVWADIWSLPYSVLPPMDNMWWMRPVLVYGYDEKSDRVSIADGSLVPLTIAIEELARARARIKKDKFRIATLEAPNPAKLGTAVQQGIWDCVKLFTEKPPKGGKNSFGFAAYKWWIESLTNPKSRMSWEKEFPAGRKMYSGLTWAFTDIALFALDGLADRPSYAAFLEEASQILDKPALQEVARQFRRSADAWRDLSLALLPDEIPPFKETRELMLKRRQIFREQGRAAQMGTQSINNRLKEIRNEMDRQFPLDSTQIIAFRENLSRHVLNIHDIEKEAIGLLLDAMK
jgi:hypothetical protein